MAHSRVLASYRGGLGTIPGRDMSVLGPLAVLRIRIRIRDPGSGDFSTPGSGIRNRFFPDPGSRIPDPKSIFLRA
jgi:hypothetical protein